jgi:YVTN family beta-propeller protein
MFKNNVLAGLCAFSLFSLAACEGSKEITTPKGDFEKGVLILNEGSFTNSNSSLSFYDRSKKTVQNDLFQSINGRPLGDVLQSVAVSGDKGFLVVNNSNKIEVVNINTLKSIAPQIDLKLPRYGVVLNKKLYVTEWVNFAVTQGQVSVIDTETYAVLKTIAVGKFPEQLLVANNGKIYVSNSGGDNISVINPATDLVEATIAVLNNPSSMVQDANNNIWIVCNGTSWTTPPLPGGLVRFSPSSPANQVRIPFAGTYGGGLVANSNKSKLYFSHNGAVYDLSLTASSLPTAKLISRRFYNVGVDTDGVLYGAVANFSGASRVIRYNAQGTALDSISTGVGTNGFLFR